MHVDNLKNLTHKIKELQIHDFNVGRDPSLDRFNNSDSRHFVISVLLLI